MPMADLASVEPIASSYTTSVGRAEDCLTPERDDLRSETLPPAIRVERVECSTMFDKLSLRYKLDALCIRYQGGHILCCKRQTIAI